MNPLTRLIRNLLIIQQNLGEVIKMVLTIQDVQLAALEGIATGKQQLAEALAKNAALSAELAFQLTQNAADAIKVKDAADAADAAELVATEALAVADAATLALEELIASEAIEDGDDQKKFQEAINAINLAVAPEDLEDPEQPVPPEDLEDPEEPV